MIERKKNERKMTAVKQAIMMFNTFNYKLLTNIPLFKEYIISKQVVIKLIYENVIVHKYICLILLFILLPPLHYFLKTYLTILNLELINTRSDDVGLLSDCKIKLLTQNVHYFNFNTFVQTS